MKELKQIIESYNKLKLTWKKCALATIVSVEGSSYRRAGARMLIAEDGKLTGAISGGCLEGDALKKALLVINENTPALVTYDTMDEDDATLGVGLGCNGIIKVLIEPIDYNDVNNAVELFKQAISVRQNCVAVTLYSLKKNKDMLFGTKLLIGENEVIYGNIIENQLKKFGILESKNVFNTQNSNWINTTQNNEEYVIFLEFIPPAINLVVIGAGNDVMPLIDMAHIIGWDTYIIDGRNNYATKERFPASCSVLVAKPEQVLSQINIDEQTVFALMTHNYNYDKAMLHLLCQNEKIKYIALLGPKKKYERIISEYNEEGRALTESQINNIYGPTGLDIGAETSEEIALSILAEIKAVMSNKNGSHLRNIKSKIH